MKLKQLALTIAFAISISAGEVFSAESQTSFAEAEREINVFAAMVEKNPELKDYAKFSELHTHLSVQTEIVLNNAKEGGADTRVLEKRLSELKKVLHHRNIVRVMKEMEKYNTLPDEALGATTAGDVASWRITFSNARNIGVFISFETEKRRKELELLAFEKQAKYALKEFKDFVECKPSRFASRGFFWGWNAYYGAALQQTELPVMIMWALETPHANQVYADYERLRGVFSQRFFASGPLHGMGAMRDYGDVCGKELKKFPERQSKINPS